jgi:KUP system potassium uptake protein
MLGGAALLADGMITPPISVTSAIRGLKQVPALHDISQWTVIYIVIGYFHCYFCPAVWNNISRKIFRACNDSMVYMLAVLGIVFFVKDLLC